MSRDLEVENEPRKENVKELETDLYLPAKQF